MSFNKYLNPKNDFAFKRLFGSEKNQDILIHFLNDMLGFSGRKKIKSVYFLKTSQDPEIAAKKQSLVDVLCKDERDRQYIVEMQIARTPGFEKRAQYYAAKAYSRQLNQGEQYPKLKAVIFLAITDFVMFLNKTEYKSDHVTLDKKTYSHDLKDFHFTFLELPKFKKSIEELSTLIEKWAYFFKHAEGTHEKEVERIVGADAVIERAYEELNRFSWSEIEINTYEQEEKRERDAQAILEQQRLDLEAQKAGYIAEGKAKGKAEGEAIGIAKGKAEGEAMGIVKGEQLARQQLALAALAEDLPLTLIQKITALSAEEIIALKTSISH